MYCDIYLLSEMHYMFIIRGTLTAKRHFFFSADDEGVSGARADGKSQAIRSFAEDPVVIDRRILQIQIEFTLPCNLLTS
jgi:hypothetical protein